MSTLNSLMSLYTIPPLLFVFFFLKPGMRVLGQGRMCLSFCKHIYILASKYMEYEQASIDIHIIHISVHT